MKKGFSTNYEAFSGILTSIWTHGFYNAICGSNLFSYSNTALKIESTFKNIVMVYLKIDLIILVY